MNERIRELAEQAGFVLWKDDSGNHGDIIDWSSSYDNELKKFAELIVRECARLNLELSYELAGVIVDTEEGIRFDSVCLNTVKQVHNSLASNQLIEHFGVEE
jgi:hypothetical protein